MSIQFNKSSLIYFLLFCSILIFQCRKNQDIILDGTDRPVLVSSGVFGQVFDPSGKPLENVEVSFNQASVYTDKSGAFLIKDQLMNKQGAQIRFRKSGYFEVYRTVIPVKGQIVNLQTQLIRRGLTKTIQSAQGGLVETNGNASVLFQANSFLDANSQPYSGNVRVYSYYLDPLADQTLWEMPGNLTGRDQDGKLVVLRTMGMVKVELEDENGSPLKLNPNLPAEMKVPIPASLLSKAEEFIPLWYYDPVKGSWIEEGKAKSNGSYYIGNVTHFTFWNWDFPYQAIHLKFRLVDEAGIPRAGLGFVIRDLTQWGHGSGATNSDGTFEGKIPENSSFAMVVFECNSNVIKTFHTQSADLDLGDVVVPNIISFRLVLSAKNCSGQPVTKGYVGLYDSLGSRFEYMPLNAGGSLDTNLSACKAFNYLLKIVDKDALKGTSDIKFNFVGQAVVDLGEITVCEELNDFIRINCLGNEYFFDAYSSNSNPPSLEFSTLGPDSIYFYMRIEDVNLSVGNPSNLLLSHPLPNVQLNCISSNCNNVNYQINYLGPKGGQIRGTFSGSLMNLHPSGPQGNVNFSGEFSVRRDK